MQREREREVGVDSLVGKLPNDDGPKSKIRRINKPFKSPS